MKRKHNKGCVELDSLGFSTSTKLSTKITLSILLLTRGAIKSPL